MSVSELPLKQSISTKLLIVVSAVYLFVVTLVTMMHMWAEYLDTRKQVEMDLKVLQKAFEREFAASIWFMDIPRLNSEMTGLMAHPVIVGIRITNDKGESFATGNVAVAEGPISHRFPLHHIAEDRQWYTVGAAALYSSRSVIIKKLQWKLMLILFASMMNMAAFWVIVYWVSNRMLSRPLAVLTAGARQLSLENLDNVTVDIGKRSKDELKILQDAFNAMVQKLLAARTELRDFTSELEERVRERTASLSKANALLKEGERRLSQIIEFQPDATMVINSAGQLIAWNHAMENLTGVKAEAMIGKGDYEYALPFYGHRRPVMIDLVTSYDDSVADKYLTIRKEGDRLVSETYLPDFCNRGPTWLWNVAAPLLDENGEVTGAIESIRDITDRINHQKALLQSEVRYKTLYREAKKTEELYHSLLDSTLDAIVIYDLAGNVTYVNQGFTRTFGWFKEDLVGGVPYTPESEHEATMEKVRLVVDDGKPIKDFETIRFNKDGKLIDVSISASRFSDGEGSPSGMFVILRDITDRKYTERLLQQAKEAAESANQAKSIFLANMSHELRTPLNAVLGYAQMLNRSRRLDKEERGHVGTIIRNGEYLLVLINDVLELSRIEANRVEVQAVSFDLHRMLTDLESMFRLQAKRKGLQLTFDFSQSAPQHICADQNKLRQVLINLVGNAIKYTNEGNIHLKVDAFADDAALNFPDSPSTQASRRLVFEISDSGIGLSDSDIGQIFDAFVRKGDQQPYNAGTGLGLAISRKFVQLMNGEIDVTSHVGKGSIFRFQIPVTVVEAENLNGLIQFDQRRILEIQDGQPDQRILVADDNDDSRRVVVEMLKTFGIRVREARNGRDAVETWRTWHPHLIFMDLRMPEVDGYSAVKIIRKEERSDVEHERSPNGEPVKCKIIALTAQAFEEDRARAMAAGCDDFIRKPFREIEIMDKLHHYLGLQFVYDASEATKNHAAPEVVLVEKAVSELSTEWISELRQGVESVDLELVESVIQKIRGQNASLADTLSQLVADFEYDEVLRLTAS